MGAEKDESEGQRHRFRMPFMEGADEPSSQPAQHREHGQHPDDAPGRQHLQPIVMGIVGAVMETSVLIKLLLLRLIWRGNPAVRSRAITDPSSPVPTSVGNHGQGRAAQGRPIVGADLLVDVSLLLEAINDGREVGHEQYSQR